MHIPTLKTLAVTLTLLATSAYAGQVYVSRLDTGDIVKVDLAGTMTPFVSGLGRPGAMKLDSAGNVLVIDHDPSTPRMRHVTPAGVVTDYENPLPGGGQFGFNDVAIADDGTVYILVASSVVEHHGEVWRLAPSQLVASLSPTAASPEDGRGMTFGPGGHLYVAMQGRLGAGPRILKVTRAGVVTPFYDPGLSDTDEMWDVRFDSQGRMLMIGVRTAATQRQIVWRLEDGVLTELVPPSVTPVIPTYAIQLAIDPADNLFTNPWDNNGMGGADGQLMVIDASGTITSLETFTDVIPDIDDDAFDTFPSICGDGTLDAGEQCDDGNLIGGDGCSITCACDSVCGDGVTEGSCEQCDDANVLACDGCVSCQVETGVTCGDGVRNAACGEQCDDGNTVEADGCTAACQEGAAPESVGVSGTTASTDSESDGATPSDPVETTVTLPSPGSISIDERPATLGAMGFQLLTQEVDITAPPASAADPLILVFRVDASRIPGGESEATLAVLKDGAPVPACAGACSGAAAPDPCTCSRALLGDGDVEITVLTSSASIWSLAVDRCGEAPETSCRRPVESGKSGLMLRNNSNDARDLVSWKWLKGDATPLESFGAPLTSTDYVFCVYDETANVPSVRLRLTAPAAGTCDGAPCWKQIGSGYKYKNRALDPDGQLQILLKASDTPGRSRIKLKAKGSAIDMTGLPLAQDGRVVAQLRNDGACWDAQYSAPPTVSDDGQFKDKSD